MELPCHGIAMELPWHCHGIALALRTKPGTKQVLVDTICSYDIPSKVSYGVSLETMCVYVCLVNMLAETQLEIPKSAMGMICKTPLQERPFQSPKVSIPYSPPPL